MSLKFQQLPYHQQLHTTNNGNSHQKQMPHKAQFSPKRIKKGNDSFEFTYGNKVYHQSSQKRKQSQKKVPNLSLFSDFDNQIANQSLAKQLIAQNMQLKTELIQIKKLATQLQSELQLCHHHIQNLTKKQSSCQHKHIISDLKNEILTILSQNKVIEKQLKSLKSSYSQFNKTNDKLNNTSYQVYQGDNTNQHSKIYRSNSYEINKKYRNVDRSFTHLADNKKSEQLLISIKGMYSKIMGHNTYSLKQLWRWLKNIGHYYSCFKKWRAKVQNVLFYSTPQTQDLIGLLQQIISQIE